MTRQRIPSNSQRSAMQERIERIKVLFQEQLAQGNFETASSIIVQIEPHLGNDPLIDAMRSTLLLAMGRFDDAKTVLLDALLRHPRSFDLLFNLAWAHEQVGDLIHAYHIYSQAEYRAAAKAQLDDVKHALQRLKAERIPFRTGYYERAFVIEFPNSEPPVQFAYSISAMRERKVLFDVVIDELHPETEKVLEIECGEGTVARNLAAAGLDVVGVDSDGELISQAIVLDFPTRVRVPEHTRRLRFLPQTVTADNSALPADEYDTIVYTPKWNSFWDASEQYIAALLTNLMEAARLQLFVALRPSGAGTNGKDEEGVPTEHGNDGESDQAERDERARVKFERVLHQVLSTTNVRWTEKVEKDIPALRLYTIDITETLSEGERRKIVPFGFDAITSPSALVDVEIDKCRDLQGFGYTEPHWHPFVALLEQYRITADLTYEESVLRRFYGAFRPENRYEQFFGRQSKPVPPLHEGWAPAPWLNGRVQHIATERPETRPGGTHFHGPNTDEFGKSEFDRVLRAYNLMQSQGYMPEIFPDGYIQGFFLKRGDDYRFVITEGQHRIAALAVLGHKVIRCHIAPEAYYPRSVDIDRVHRWPQVRSGLYSVALASRMFRRFFDEDNRARLEEWGLEINS